MSHRIVLNGWVAGLLAVGFVPAGLAADLIKQGNRATPQAMPGPMSQPIKRGEAEVSVSIDAVSDVVDQTDFQFEESTEDREKLLEAARYGSFYFAMGVLEAMEIGLGVHGVEEQRSEFLLASGLSDDLGPSGGFLGASLYARWTILRAGGWGLTVTPYAETGSGELPESSLTRSKKAKGGWILGLDYDWRRRLGATLSGGARYRDAEDIGSLRVRNEWFARSQVQYMWTRHVGTSLMASTRTIMVSPTEVAANQERTYEGRTGADAGLGFVFAFDETKIGLHYLHGIQRELGVGQSNFGLTISQRLGGRQRLSEWTEDDADDQEADDAILAEDDELTPEELGDIGEGEENPLAAPTVQEIENIDRQQDPDDFDKLRKVRAEDKDRERIKEQQQMDEELQQLREDEAAFDKKQAKDIEAAEKKSFKENREIFRDNEDKRRRYLEGEDDPSEEIPVVDKADVNFRGLE